MFIYTTTYIYFIILFFEESLKTPFQLFQTRVPPKSSKTSNILAFDLNPNCGHTSKGPIFHPAIFFIPGTLIGKHLL